MGVCAIVRRTLVFPRQTDILSQIVAKVHCIPIHYKFHNFTLKRMHRENPCRNAKIAEKSWALPTKGGICFQDHRSNWEYEYIFQKSFPLKYISYLFAIMREIGRWSGTLPKPKKTKTTKWLCINDTRIRSSENFGPPASFAKET